MPSSRRMALAAALISIVWSAFEFLFWSTLQILMYFEMELLVYILHVHAVEDNKIDTWGIDWGFIEDTFMEDANGILLTQQPLRFKRYNIRYPKCPICISDVTQSTRSYTSRLLFENYNSIVNEYLDSKSLHHRLLVSLED
jgi:hypothetical protein